MDRKFPKSARLLKRYEFRLVYDTGSRYRNGGFHLFVRSRTAPDQPTRIGLTATRAAGKAVARNRLRRRARECFRHLSADLRPGRDIVANLHGRLAHMPHHDFDRLFRDVLQKAHLLKPGKTNR